MPKVTQPSTAYAEPESLALLNRALRALDDLNRASAAVAKMPNHESALGYLKKADYSVRSVIAIFDREPGEPEIDVYGAGGVPLEVIAYGHDSYVGIDNDSLEEDLRTMAREVLHLRERLESL
jgi:hypothetical protein